SASSASNPSGRESPSHALPPAAVVVRDETHAERAVVVHRLGAGPAHGAADALRLDLGAQAQLPAFYARRERKARLAQPAPERVARVEAAAHAQLAVRRLHEDAQHAGHARNAVVDEGHHQLRRPLALPLPYPGRADAVPEALPERAEALGI